tara:strand:+ start:1450 stop:1596 length:147 start_codon:yes stop_codon:yes gene_type:complete
MEMLAKLIEFLKIKYGFFKMKVFYKFYNLEYRVRKLERARYWREKYKR